MHFGCYEDASDKLIEVEALLAHERVKEAKNSRLPTSESKKMGVTLWEENHP